MSRPTVGDARARRRRPTPTRRAASSAGSRRSPPGIARGHRRVRARTAVAVERVFAQHNLPHRDGHGPGERHRAARRRASAGSRSASHTPSEVKAAITGYGAADKAQVRAMVARVLRLDAVPKPADAADALALAICHAWRGGAGRGIRRALTPAQRAWADAERLAQRA